MPEQQTKALSLIAAYGFAAERGLAHEAAEIRNMAIDGFKNQSSVRRGYMAKLLEANGLMDEFKDKYWSYGKTRGGESKYRRYLRLREQHERLQAGEEPLSDMDVDPNSDEESATDQGFALEADLRDFLANNISIIDSGLHLYNQEGQTGIEFSIGNGYIDILAKDREGRLVVIELKLSRGRNRTIGQLLYYMGWVDKHLGNGTPCRGIIIAREITEDLLVATRRVPGVSLYRYRVTMAIEQVSEYTQ
jgi:hypothetical protein